MVTGGGGRGWACQASLDGTPAFHSTADINFCHIQFLNESNYRQGSKISKCPIVLWCAVFIQARRRVKRARDYVTAYET